MFLDVPGSFRRFGHWEKKNKKKLKNISSDFSRNNEILNFERVYNPHDIPAVRRGLGGQG